MYYAVELFTKKGKFAVLWLAAHWEKQLNKQKVLEIDVLKSCKDVKNHMPDPSISKHRLKDVPFSLRLSVQLLLGIVRIYYRQVKYLHDESNDILSHIKVQVHHNKKIDLPSNELIAPTSHITHQEDHDALLDLNYEHFDLPLEELFSQDISNDFSFLKARAADITLSEIDSLEIPRKEENLLEMDFSLPQHNLEDINIMMTPKDDILDEIQPKPFSPLPSFPSEFDDIPTIPDISLHSDEISIPQDLDINKSLLTTQSQSQISFPLSRKRKKFEIDQPDNIELTSEQIKTSLNDTTDIVGRKNMAFSKREKLINFLKTASFEDLCNSSIECDRDKELFQRFKRKSTNFDQIAGTITKLKVKEMETIPEEVSMSLPEISMISDIAQPYMDFNDINMSLPIDNTSQEPQFELNHDIFLESQDEKNNITTQRSEKMKSYLQKSLKPQQTIKFNDLHPHFTKRLASQTFFQILVLRNEGMINISQDQSETGFPDINISALPPLFE